MHIEKIFIYSVVILFYEVGQMDMPQLFTVDLTDISILKVFLLIYWKHPTGLWECISMPYYVSILQTGVDPIKILGLLFTSHNSL